MGVMWTSWGHGDSDGDMGTWGRGHLNANGVGTAVVTVTQHRDRRRLLRGATCVSPSPPPAPAPTTSEGPRAVRGHRGGQRGPGGGGESRDRVHHQPCTRTCRAQCCALVHTAQSTVCHAPCTPRAVGSHPHRFVLTDTHCLHTCVAPCTLPHLHTYAHSPNVVHSICAHAQQPYTAHSFSLLQDWTHTPLCSAAPTACTLTHLHTHQHAPTLAETHTWHTHTVHMHISHILHDHPYSCKPAHTHLHSPDPPLLVHLHKPLHTPTHRCSPHLTHSQCTHIAAAHCTLTLTPAGQHVHTSVLTSSRCLLTCTNPCTLPHLHRWVHSPHVAHSDHVHLQQLHLAHSPSVLQDCTHPLLALTPVHTCTYTHTPLAHSCPSNACSHPPRVPPCPFALPLPHLASSLRAHSPLHTPPHPLHTPSPCMPAPYLAWRSVGCGGAAGRYKGAGPPRHPAPPPSPRHPAPPGPTHWKFPTFHSDTWGGGGTEARNWGGEVE